MDIALVENAENHIHDEDGSKDEKGERAEKLLKDEAFALQFTFDRWRQNLGRRLFNEVSYISKCGVGLGVEPEGDGRKLVQMVDRLEPKPGDRLGEGANGNERVLTLGPHVKLAQVFGTRAIRVLYFEDDLVLIVRLLNEVNVVLRIGRAQQALDFRDRNAVRAGPLAIDINIEVRLVAK